MLPFEVTDVRRMSAILDVFSFLDDVRWNNVSNYNSVNYCRDDLTEAEKLLTHWLCYIMDRQMPFERIWDIGGYVISHLVHTYTTNPGKSAVDVFTAYIRREGDTFHLEAPLDQPNDKLKRYGIVGDRVPFASRYMPEDLVLIYHTLGVLDKVAGRNMGHFLCLTLGKERNLEQGIRRMAFALNQLTYAVGGSVSGNKFAQRMEEIEREVADFELEVNMNGSLFGRKRLWCSLRDYLKSPEFNPIFVASLEKSGYPDADRWRRNSDELKAALRVLELPGDLWNNAGIFRRGLFSPYVSNERKTWDMPRTIREIYEFISRIEATPFYPEQLDVSFDFVPRMCRLAMCAVCPFGSGIEEVCHQNPDLLCPIVLYSCGYMYRCDPSSCEIKKNSVKGFCKSSYIEGADETGRVG